MAPRKGRLTLDDHAEVAKRLLRIEELVSEIINIVNCKASRVRLLDQLLRVDNRMNQFRSDMSAEMFKAHGAKADDDLYYPRHEEVKPENVQWLTGEQLSKMEIQPQVKPDNEWEYVPKTNEVTHRRMRYPLDLDKAKTSAQVLDWLFQVYNKTWCSAKTLHDLMDHFYVRVNPQATLCSWGREQSGRKKESA